ncbi:MAG: YdeI/OmpD-associated family protein [Chloroflexi bacterium]|nr:YdeI/OmpD-associated family protein [Chloroflexota bacterium]
MEPCFFTTPAEFRAWLAANHETGRELWVGFYKKGSGRSSITWPEAVDEALCFGWIDSVRRSVDADSYANRFTPRQPRSTWSAVNIQRVEELTRLGRMRPAGLTAFAARTAARSGTYSFEQRATVALGEDYERRFRANQAAWDFFQAQAAGYRRTASWWVISAKREETRLRRLATLIDDSAQGRAIALLARRPRSE